MSTEISQVPEATPERAVIVHGYRANPDDHWFPWLAQQFEKDGIQAKVPVLPSSDEPDAKRWQEAVSAALGTPDEHTTIVAHSLGCLTVLRYLGALSGSWRLGTLVLVSGFLEALPAISELDEFIAGGCDVTSLSAHIDRLVIFRSDNDALVPAAHTDHLARLLGVPVQVVPGAGHFLADEGFTSLPQVYEALR